MPSSLEPNELAKHLFENAKCIAVVHDELGEAQSESRSLIESNRIQEHRERGREYCENAQHVYAIGFAFARANIGLIGLDRSTERDQDGEDEPMKPDDPKPIIHYINFDDSFGLRARVKNLCEQKSDNVSGDPNRSFKSNEMTAGPGRTLQISEALIAGFLGEMPS
jgi:hypothetical protein